MTTLKELLAQKEALDRQIETTRQQDRASAIEKVRTMMDEYGLTADDFSSRGAPRARAATQGGPVRKVAAKYRNTKTGETWSGRGLQPKWLRAQLADGRKLEDFAV